MKNDQIEQLLKEQQSNQKELIAETEEMVEILKKEQEETTSNLKAKVNHHGVNYDDEDIDHLFIEESEHIKRLHHIVRDTIKKEKLIINNLLHPTEEVLTRGQKISDKVASFGGSWRFIIYFAIFLLIWMLVNVLIPAKLQFDSYPFIFLNLILSCIAAIQAPIIMMSQNRMEEKDRMRNENDYLINLKAEMQIRSLHKKMNLLLEKQIATLYESQAQQLAVLKQISQKLDSLKDKS